MKLIKSKFTQMILCASIVAPAAFAADMVSVNINGENYSCTKGAGTARSLICSKFSDRYFPTRIEDGATLGGSGYSTSESCQQSISTQQTGVICTKYRDRYFPTRISDGTTLGQSGYSTLEACINSLGIN